MNQVLGIQEWWRGREWTGMKPDPRYLRVVRSASGNLHTCASAHVPCTPFSWVEWAIPAESQHGPSCVGHGIANFKELMLRRYCGRQVLGEWEQINGDKVHARACEMFYNGDRSNGVYIDEGFRAALDMGIFAPGSELRKVPRSEAMQSGQFLLTPFIDGRDISGWSNHGTSPDNGQVYEGMSFNFTAGHCTVDVSRLEQDGRNFWQDLNSWGPRFGWHGMFIMSEKYDGWTGLEDFKYYVVEPEGWEQWDGWRKWITR